MRELRHAADPAERDLLIGADGIVDAYRDAFFLMEIERYHASDDRRVLGQIFRPCQVVDHGLIDIDRSVRACDDIAAPRNCGGQGIDRYAVPLKRLEYLFLSESELLHDIAKRSELLHAVSDGIVEHLFVIVIDRDLARSRAEIHDEYPFLCHFLPPLVIDFYL